MRYFGPLAEDVVNHPERLNEPERFVSARRFAIIWVRAMKILRNMQWPYHNLLHVHRMDDRLVSFLKDIGTPVELIRIWRLVPLFHDMGHPGYTYRQLARGVPGGQFSNEEWHARVADRWVQYDLSLPRRIWVQECILGTAFGQSDRTRLPKAHPGVELYRGYAPTTPDQLLVAFADIGDFLHSTTLWQRTSLNVLEEKRAHEIPGTFQDWLLESGRFLDYAGGMLGGLQRTLTPRMFEFCRLQLELRRRDLDALSNPAHPDHHPFRRQFEAVCDRVRERCESEG